MSTLQELKLKAEKKITSIPFNTDPKGIVKFASEQIQQVLISNLGRFILQKQ
jgi:hypothetical protein